MQKVQEYEWRLKKKKTAPEGILTKYIEPSETCLVFHACART